MNAFALMSDHEPHELTVEQRAEIVRAMACALRDDDLGVHAGFYQAASPDLRRAQTNILLRELDGAWDKWLLAQKAYE